MNLVEKKEKLAAIENEQKTIVSEKTEEAVSAILGTFRYYADYLENDDYRFLAGYSGLSIGTVHAWFPKNQVEGKGVVALSQETKKKSEKKLDGPRMINVIRAACLVNIALPDVLDFVKESPWHYDEVPNSWNVFVQNMRSMRNVILRMRNDSLYDIGWITSDMDEEEKECTRKLTNHAGKIAKYYNKIIQDASGDEKEEGMNIGKLIGNPKCELRTIIIISRCLNEKISLSKWFQRWGANETICEGQDRIVLYDDEKEKLPLIAPYIVGEKRDSMMAIRVGNIADMERYYSALAEKAPTFRMYGQRPIAMMNNVRVRGWRWMDQVHICNWKELFRERCIQEGDLLFMFAVKKKVFGRPQNVVINLSRMSMDEIMRELEKAEAQNLFKNIWISPKENDWEYTVRPDNESIEEFYQNDPLWLYHFEDENDTQDFYSPKFLVEPDNRCLERVQNHQMEMFGPDSVMFESANRAMYELLEAGPESTEVKIQLLDAKSKFTANARKFAYYSSFTNAIEEQIESSVNPVDSVRVARFVRSTQSELRLSSHFMLSSGDIILSRKQPCDYTVGVHKQRITEFELPIVSWTKKYVTERLAEKVEDILRESYNPRFDEEFIRSYQERIRKSGIDELIKRNRLWLQIQLPTNLDGKIQWYWHVDNVPRID